MRVSACVVLLLTAAGCAGSTARLGAPSWFEGAPEAGSTFHFYGHAGQAADADMARDLAIQDALQQLSLKVGAKLTSRFEALDQEVDGESHQVVKSSVEVEGEPIELQDLTVRKALVRPVSDAFEAYVLIEWPKAQYDAVLAANRNRAERALALFEAAKQAEHNNDLITAKSKLKEAQSLVGSGIAAVPLDSKSIKDTGVLRRAIETLTAKITSARAAQAQVCAVGVRCLREGAETDCNDARIGAMRQVVTNTGRKVAPGVVPASVISAILDSTAPRVDAELRAAGCIVAVQFTAKLLAKVDPFTYIRYGARGVVFDTATERITHSHEVPPTKMGHVNYSGAMKKGFDRATKTLATELSNSLSEVR